MPLNDHTSEERGHVLALRSAIVIIMTIMLITGALNAGGTPVCLAFSI